MITKQFSSAATNNAQVVATRGTDLYSVTAYNAGVAVAYVKLYNKVTTPAPATDVPFMVFAVPAGGHTWVQLAEPVRLSAGMGVATVTGAADTDNTAVAAGQLKVAIVHGG